MPVEQQVIEVVEYIDDPDWDGEEGEEVVEIIVREEVLVPRRSTISIPPHEVGILCKDNPLDDDDDDEEEVVEIVEEMVMVPWPRRSTRTIAPHEVGIICARSDADPMDRRRRQLRAEIAATERKIAAVKAARAGATAKREDSETSVNTKSTMDSWDSDGEELDLRATMRLSVVTARAVQKLRQRLVTKQLRDRLREHQIHHAQRYRDKTLNDSWHVNRSAHQKSSLDGASWHQIIGAIGTAKQSLKPVPITQRRDSSTFVSKDHPYLRELRAVQADVLPVWRQQTYSYWI